MAEQESMVPVAAIVCFLLGVTSLILLERSKNRIWMDRLAGYMLSWCLVFFGLRYAAASIRDTSWWQNTDITSQFDFFQYLFFSFTISAFVIVAIFCSNRTKCYTGVKKTINILVLLYFPTF